jgi:hypothetical protein
VDFSFTKKVAVKPETGYVQIREQTGVAVNMNAASLEHVVKMMSSENSRLAASWKNVNVTTKTSNTASTVNIERKGGPLRQFYQYMRLIVLWYQFTQFTMNRS